MSKLLSIKSALAATAGMMALATWAPSAEAGTLTYDVSYTGYFDVKGTLQSTSDAELLVSVDSTPVDTNYLGNYTVYKVTSISGVRNSVSVSSADTGSGAGLYDDTEGGLFSSSTAYSYDDYILVNNTTGAIALTTTGGIAYDTSDGYSYLIYAVGDDAGVVVDGETFYYEETASNKAYAYLSIKGKQVPAPTALAVLGMSLVGLGVVRRRKRS